MEEKGLWRADDMSSTLPEELEAFRCAGFGCEGSAAPGVIVAPMEPELEDSERRSSRVKVPVIWLELV